ncbi:Vms1/Ankzf1 family peptidyl-tRNA hydrolase [Halovivax limisalsi]|uniref:Vms1/Ankzf1 family peptidyl-tRNA hydrolase n=1 Tax=Halovivax limisalsi TaxID=1453760 RepID=UPI001FFCECBE|nr:Vms1/Ankzf1 family peptidyl-tRNA hydrolase [Halovivax limisalsi]
MSRLDALLGRASLKERIAELEADLEDQRARYEAESERRREAVRGRQRAEERVNRLEDRIAQLEGELERTDAGDRAPEPRRRESLRGERAAAVLDRLRSIRSDPESVLTAWVSEANAVPGPVESLLGERARLAAAVAPCLVVADDAEVVSVALDPPIEPAIDAVWADRPRLESGWFRPTGSFRFALVRADLFALGTYEGTEQVDFVGFESDVKSAHSKGGFSQARFERVREGQIDDHLDASREAIEATRSESGVETLYLVGERDAVDALADALDPAATGTVDATGKPAPALEDAFRSFFTTELVAL